MNTIKNIKILLVIQLFFYAFAQGQFKSRISLEVNSVEYDNGNITIKYNINNSKQKDKIRVWINIFDSKNDTVFAKTWSGDVNKFVSGSNPKIAVWNIKNDGVDIVDSIQVKISASVQNGLCLDNPFVLSTVFPGWGDYQIKPKKPYWIYGAVAYSFIGTSIYLNSSSANNYNNYLTAETISDKDNYFNKANASNVLSYAFLGAAGVVWALDYIGLIKRTRQIKKKWDNKFPIEETLDIPNFRIATVLSPPVFINTALTNLSLVENSAEYSDKDNNHLIDAYEKGFITFKLENHGPARAVHFYVDIESDVDSTILKYPKHTEIGAIPVNETRLVKVPVSTSEKVKNGYTYFNILVNAEHNNPVPKFGLNVKTVGFDYPNGINRQDLVSDIDKNIPVVDLPNPRKYALIIGNEGYANSSTGLSSNFNVPFARNDAIIFKEYAMKILGVPENNITLLLDANRTEMHENILTISKQVSKIKDKAQLIFFYAGHGLADTLTKAPYLIPVDVAPTEIDNAIPLEFLYKKIWESRSSQSLVVMDASFNNGGRKIGLRGPFEKMINPRKEVISGNTVVFLAVSEEHTSNAYQEKKHGLFTYYFLKILKESKGNINLLKLSNSINESVSAKAEELGYHQMPITLVSIAVRDSWQAWKVK